MSFDDEDEKKASLMEDKKREMCLIIAFIALAF
jgi:hypothetical protein